MELTEEQKNIVVTTGKPMLVLAGPGTGKTEVLAQRILHLLMTGHASKEGIVGITFTTKAAEQMRRRLCDLGLQIEDQPLICTLHSLSMKLLKDKGHDIGIPEDFVVADKYEASLLLRDAILDVRPEAARKLKEWSSKILLLKAERKSPADLGEGLLRRIFKRYQTLLQLYRALDFQDLITSACDLLEICPELTDFWHERCKNLLVDEFQDVNRAEYSLIRLLANGGAGLFVVGDDKQSIYGWRGGDPGIVLGFTQDFTGAIEKPMTVCFRCPSKIIRGADSFIGRSPPLEPAKQNSESICILICKSEVQEARYISQWILSAVEKGQYSPEDIAILYRGGDIADKVAEEVEKKGIPIVRPSPEETRRLRELTACLRLIMNRQDSLALRVCFASALASGIGGKGIKCIREYAETHRCSLWQALLVARVDDGFRRWRKPLEAFSKTLEDLSTIEAETGLCDLLKRVAAGLGYETEPRIAKVIRESEKIPKEWSLGDLIQEIRGLKGERSADPKESAEEETNAVLFITTHSVKGLQRKAVFVLGLEKGSFPHPKADLEEQRRLCYVAMTRAREKLFLCYAKRRQGRLAEGFSFSDPSPFISEIPDSCKELLEQNDHFATQ